ncbi:MAG: hypothetical protein C3F08_05310 [Candidatus Methylomirabilota bacterium]|nr:MAG: hypothetical protein C3F08_05310 [candidate division NC10 bacterium]
MRRLRGYLRIMKSLQTFLLHRIISADRDLTRARLAQAAALRVVMADALALLGVSALERM